MLERSVSRNGCLALRAAHPIPATPSENRGLRDHIKMRSLDTGSTASDKGESRNLTQELRESPWARLERIDMVVGQSHCSQNGGNL